MGGLTGASAKGSTTPPIDTITDAERVQKCVERLADEIRAVFEAYHIGLIRGDMCLEVVKGRRRTMTHKKRALLLGISERSYYTRLRFAESQVSEWLAQEFEFVQ